jgi:hypothetical protein
VQRRGGVMVEVDALHLHFLLRKYPLGWAASK